MEVVKFFGPIKYSCNPYKETILEIPIMESQLVLSDVS